MTVCARSGDRRTEREWLVKNANGKTEIIKIDGTVGSSPANDRRKGFDDVIKAESGFTNVASQAGDVSRDKGRREAETLIQAQAHPDANVIYTHADEMAMGAIAALEAAGKKPGKDVRIVSVDGKIGAIFGCSPFFGPRILRTVGLCCRQTDSALHQKWRPVL
jgi:galactofuranose transport system substrate-binding protein